MSVKRFAFGLPPLLAVLTATALAQALVKLYQDNAATLTPDPLHSAFYDSHPPAAIRISRLAAGTTDAAAAPAPA
jgi:STE24 endopeptidase